MKKLCPELIEEFNSWVDKDIPFCVCCDAVEITEGAFYGWMDKGLRDLEAGNDNTLECLLYRTIKKTYANVIAKSIERIKLGRLGWQGEAWMRERRDKWFAKMDNMNINNNDKNIAKVTLEYIDPNKDKDRVAAMEQQIDAGTN